MVSSGARRWVLGVREPECLFGRLCSACNFHHCLWRACGCCKLGCVPMLPRFSPCSYMELRGPLDVINLATLFGLTQQQVRLPN